jgi:hypothetical protein
MIGINFCGNYNANLEFFGLYNLLKAGTSCAEKFLESKPVYAERIL